jgi:hypothetical protein
VNNRYRGAADSLTGWRRLFILLQILVVVTVLGLPLIEHVWGTPIQHTPGLAGRFFGGFFLLAWLFLMVVSPFFLRSLRGVAWAGG